MLLIDVCGSQWAKHMDESIWLSSRPIFWTHSSNLFVSLVKENSNSFRCCFLLVSCINGNSISGRISGLAFSFNQISRRTTIYSSNQFSIYPFFLNQDNLEMYWCYFFLGIFCITTFPFWTNRIQ